MIKQKKCKGQGKAKGYKGCGNIVEANTRRYGLCFSCYPDFLLTTDAGKVIVAKATLKAISPRQKAEEDLKKAFSEKKSRSVLSNEIEKTQKIVNKYVRLRDQGKPCISQKISWKKDFEAGHLFSKKTHSAIRFDYDNIHGQSVYANRHLYGDFDNYLANLPNRIGKDRTEALQRRADDCKKFVKKWTIEELKEIQEHTKKLIKEL